MRVCVCVRACVCVCVRACMCVCKNSPESSELILRVSDQNGISQLYIIVQIHHSGRKPSVCSQNGFSYFMWLELLLC